MFQPVGRRYNYYFDDRRDCIRYSVTVGLSRALFNPKRGIEMHVPKEKKAAWVSKTSHQSRPRIFRRVYCRNFGISL